MGMADVIAAETAVGEIAEKINVLKKDGADKDVIKTHVDELLARKEALKLVLEAEMAKLSPDSEEYATLQAKIPVAPKPSKKDKKATGSDDAQKEANRKAAEEAKAAARAKKKDKGSKAD